MRKFKDFLELESLSLVCLGSFNPSIIQPSWLALHNLIGNNEFESASIEIIHNGISRFTIGTWLTVDVNQNRFEVRTTMKPYFLPLKDLFNNIFKILKETPITSIGINNIFELNLKNAETYFEIGKKLTPLTFWEMNDPRLFKLEIFERENLEIEGMSRLVTIKSSDHNKDFGVFIGLNNHFNFQNNSSKGQISEHMWFTTDNSSEKLMNSFFENLRL